MYQVQMKEHVLQSETFIWQVAYTPHLFHLLFLFTCHPVLGSYWLRLQMELVDWTALGAVCWEGEKPKTQNGNFK